uniref:Transposase DDE domain-containing protein n=1 Tax=Anguilla anguilla TaxID=7936 RepID=A0A0E9P804_ANGAN
MTEAIVNTKRTRTETMFGDRKRHDSSYSYSTRRYNKGYKYTKMRFF